jgi:hypothetical protein
MPMATRNTATTAATPDLTRSWQKMEQGKKTKGQTAKLNSRFCPSQLAPLNQPSEDSQLAELKPISASGSLLTTDSTPAGIRCGLRSSAKH